MKNKKTLTTKQKLAAYKWARKRIFTEEGPHICILLLLYVENKFPRLHEHYTEESLNVFDLFPEMIIGWKRRNKKHVEIGGFGRASSWWDQSQKSNKKRVEVLTEIINQLSE